MSQITKRALASALKELLEHKPLNKITIADITEQCGVNRQTFYYHFQDIYALLEWIYTTDAQRLLEGKRDGDTWQQGFLQVLEYIRDNRALVRNTYHSVSRELLEGYLYRVTYQLMRDVVEERAAGTQVPEEDRAFLAHFYKYAFVGLVLDWIRTGMKGEPAELARRVELVVDLQSRIMDGYNEQRLGTCMEVLCEGFDHNEGCYVGRTYADSVDIDGRVLFTAAGLIPAGEFVWVRITGVSDGDLTGEIEE